MNCRKQGVKGTAGGHIYVSPLGLGLSSGSWTSDRVEAGVLLRQWFELFFSS